MNLKKLSFLDIQIEKMTYGGSGLARHEGVVYFVEGAVPGQLVRLKNIKLRKNFARAEIAEVLESSPAQLSKSGCEFFGTCGGCQWLHCKMNEQSTWKESFIRDAIERVAKLTVPDQFTFYSSSTQHGSRNRIRLRVAKCQSGDSVGIGYYRKSSHEVVTINDCLIAEKPIRSWIAGIGARSWPFEVVQEFSVEAQVSFEGDLFLSLKDLSGASKDTVKKLCDFFEDDPLVKRCSVYDPPIVTFDQQFGIKYLSYTGQFQQVHKEQNRQVRELVRNWSKDFPEGCQVLDLFSGSGNLSLALAKDGLKVKAVEVSGKAVDSGLKSARENKIKSIDFIKSPVLDFLRNLARPEGPLVVVCDPPREGMKEEVQEVIRLKPEIIIYMSCDPNTLARDLKQICSNGYQMRKVLGFDFFPNTYHVETLVWLEK